MLKSPHCILHYDEDPLVREKYRQSQRRKTRARHAQVTALYLALRRGPLG